MPSNKILDRRNIKRSTQVNRCKYFSMFSSYGTDTGCYCELLSVAISLLQIDQQIFGPNRDYTASTRHFFDSLLFAT